jgi:hypothetical protein
VGAGRGEAEGGQKGRPYDENARHCPLLIFIVICVDSPGIAVDFAREFAERCSFHCSLQ